MGSVFFTPTNHFSRKQHLLATQRKKTKMPITPRFKLSQTETHLTVTIHIPHIRVSASSLEVLVEGSDFHFFSSPYLLYLSFPGRLLDDAETCRESKASYDPSNQNGVLTVVIYKEEEGIWPDLDLLGNLVNRSGAAASDSVTPSKEKIEVLSSSENETTPDDDENQVGTFTEDLKSCLKPHYGFLNMHHSVFTAYAREGLSHEMLEIPNPDETPSEDRRDLRLDAETEMFDADRYLGDLFLSDDPDSEEADMIYVEAVRMVPHWEKDVAVDELIGEMKKLDTEESTSPPKKAQDFFSADESLRLVSTKSQIPPLSQVDKEPTFLSLMDILYAYAYDHRTTFGDATCESSWTIVMLSPTLSWFESYTPPYDHIAQVLRWSIRRAMIYPYLRNYSFVARQVVKDVAAILSGGRRVVLRCLLQIQKILEGSEFHYLFNKLYISPYISWIQMIGDDDLAKFAAEVKSCISDDSSLAKSTLQLDLELLERNAFKEGSASESSSDDDSDEDSSSSSEEESDGGGNHTNLLDDQIGNGSLLNISEPTGVLDSGSELIGDASKKKVLISEM